jgi:hypothetical protein
MLSALMLQKSTVRWFEPQRYESWGKDVNQLVGGAQSLGPALIVLQATGGIQFAFYINQGKQCYFVTRSDPG